MGVLIAKEGVQFTVIAPAGFKILAALEFCADLLKHDITITSACDGAHSGENDPHHFGRAYDVRIHDWDDPQALLKELVDTLGTEKFFAWIEDANTPNAHLHCQLRHGLTYP